MEKEETKTTIELLKEAYTALKEGNPEEDILKLADDTIKDCLIIFQSKTEEAWETAKESKPDIKQFYENVIAPDYAQQKNLNVEKVETTIKKEVTKLFRNLYGSPYAGGKNAFNAYINELKKSNNINDYTCYLFPAINQNTPLIFPISTLSFIAGRPGAGKTTALASVAMHALRNTNKKVLFITTEETPAQIITRFVKNQFCNNCRSSEKTKLIKSDYKEKSINNTFKDIILKHYEEHINTLPGIDPEQLADFPGEVIRASQEIDHYFKSERLQIFDLARTTNFQDLKDVLLEQEQYTIVLLDYIQNLPYGAVENQEGSESGRREDIRKSTQVINDIIKNNDLIGIAGAQFNRMGADENKPTPLDLTYMGDSGSLERIAHIVIGLGTRKGEGSIEYFYTVLKNREGDKSTLHFKLVSDYYRYSYITPDKMLESGDLIPIYFNYEQPKEKKSPAPAKKEAKTYTTPGGAKITKGPRPFTQAGEF